VVLENRTGWHKKVEDSGIGERRRTDGWLMVGEQMGLGWLMTAPHQQQLGVVSFSESPAPPPPLFSPVVRC